MHRLFQALRDRIGRLMDHLGRFRLMTAYLLILVVAFVVLPLTLVISNHNARNLIRADYQEYNETIFHQAEARLNASLGNLTTLCYTYMPSTILAEYLSSTDFSGRVALQNDVSQEFNRLIAIQNDIRAISLYQTDGRRVAYVGIKYNQETSFTPTDSITYGGIQTIEGEVYFSVTLPVFDVSFSQVRSKLGYCQLLVSSRFLEKSLTEIMPNPDYYYVLVTEDGSVILENGEVPETVLTETADKGEVLYVAKLEHVPWRIIFGVPGRSLYANLNSLQRNYYLTYTAVALIFILMFLILHATVFRPIHRQIRFMNQYAQTREGRMQVTARNEMGELADNLNRMLDEIERLTAENLRAREHLLQVEYEKKRSELLAYRNQINPHFLSNTFECIRGMALYHHVPDIASIADALSSLFSYNLRGKGYAEVREISEHIADYTSVIGYRFNNRYAISVHVQEGADHLIFPKMIVQPLVENAIFHGLETREENGEVRVDFRKAPDDSERMEVRISDNGEGMTEEEMEQLLSDLRDYDLSSTFPERRHGIGVLNVYRRLRLFYEDTLRFQVKSRQGEGTEIFISVPVVREGEAKDVQSLFD